MSLNDITHYQLSSHTEGFIGDNDGNTEVDLYDLDKGAGIFHSARQCIKGEVTWFWHFRASDFHETFTRSSLALNTRRKLISDPKLAIHGKIMARNGDFFMEF